MLVLRDPSNHAVAAWAMTRKRFAQGAEPMSLAQHCVAALVCTVDLESVLRQIDANSRDLYGGRPFRFKSLLTHPLWRGDAVNGGASIPLPTPQGHARARPNEERRTRAVLVRPDEGVHGTPESSATHATDAVSQRRTSAALTAGRKWRHCGMPGPASSMVVRAVCVAHAMPDTHDTVTMTWQGACARRRKH